MFNFNKKLTTILIVILFISIQFLNLPKSVSAAPGDLDTSFGVGGKVVNNNLGVRHLVQDSVIQPDGKIIVTGQKMSQSGNSTFFTTRYYQDGSIDDTFGSGGEVVTIYDNFNSISKSIVIQPGGKIIVGGYVYDENREYFALARYNIDGSIDTSFGNAGTTITEIGINARLEDLIILSDGGLIAVGTSTFYYNNGTQPGFALVRYNNNGDIDTNFGVAGKVTTGFTGNAYAGIETFDEKIVIGGTGSGFTLARYNLNGDLDQTFDNDGIWYGSQFTPDGYYFPLGTNNYTSLSSLIIQADGKIIAGGSINRVSGPNQGYPDFGLARFNIDGSIDTTFGMGGWTNTDFGYLYDNIYGLALQIDGEIIAVGQTNDFSSGGFALARYNTDGNLDTTFGTNGKITTIFSGYQNARAENVLIQTDNKIVPTGMVWSGSGFDTDIAMARYFSDFQNQPPAANAGIDQSGNQTSNFIFDGSSSTDPDGNQDIVNYQWDFGDGTTSSGVTTNHTYNNLGMFTVTLTVTDSAGATNSDTLQVEVKRQLTTLSPANFWVGLKNSDSVGLHFDLLAEVYKNNTELISSGQLEGISGGSSGFNNANLQSILLPLSNPIDFPIGSVLSIKLSVRNACSGPTHNSGYARLWYNDLSANSQFGASIGSDTSNFYLLNNFLLSTTVGTDPKKTIDVQVGSPCSVFKTFGTWNITP